MTICGVGDGAVMQLAKLLTQADQQDRSAARQVEDAADQAAMQNANEHVAELQEKADADRNAALVAGIGGIAAGLCTAAPAAGGSSRWFDAASKVAEKGGDLAGGVYKAESGHADAVAAKVQALSEADIRRFNQAHEDVQAANASMQKVEQWAEQIQQTQNATLLTVATYRA
jgi:hypothetical protein